LINHKRPYKLLGIPQKKIMIMRKEILLYSLVAIQARLGSLEHSLEGRSASEFETLQLAKLKKAEEILIADMKQA